MRSANKFRRAAEFCTGACSCDDCRCFTAPYQSSCVGVHTSACFNGQGFAREHRLVKLHRPTGQVHIGCNHSAQRQLHQVATYQFRGRYSLPHAIALHRSIECETRLQGRQGCLGTALLEKSKCGIENQQSRDDQRLVILMQCKLKHNGGFEQPWNRRPELGQCIAQRVRGYIRHCIGPVFFKARARLIAREPLRGDVLTWLSRLAC